jgi:hypothetical protein
MSRRAIWALVILFCLMAPAAVRAQGNYLDVYIVKVKPEKAGDFSVVAKKIADANRRFNGDHWLAAEVVYGEGDTFMFTSPRQDYADIDKANDIFMGALQKAYGKDGAEKILRDWENCLASSRTELRRRRWDLSRKAPTDAASYAKLVGESRLLRTTAVHIKPGHIAEFEGLLKEVQETGEKNADTQPLLVAQEIEGGKGTTFYLTALRSSLGGFDKNPTTRQILGEEGYKKFQQISSDSVETADSMILRFSADLSNPPEEIAQVAADFWTPKQIVAKSSPKAKAVDKGAQVQPTSAKPQ